MRKRNKLITSYDYVPGFRDLGMTEIEFYNFSRENPVQLERIIESWIESNNRKIAESRADKERLAKLEAKRHWYNTADKNELREAIDATRVLADIILGKVIERQTNQRFIDYYTNLKERVKYGMFSFPRAKEVQLSKFPHYDSFRNEIYGSNTRIVKLWCHVFSLNK